MITPSQIREKNLSTVQSGGYDKEEVNALLAQIVESYQAVYDENKELYRKMEILAGKIEEYRSEEDSIKTALITAQKMADRIAKDAKEKAEEKLSESAATAQQTVTDAKEKRTRWWPRPHLCRQLYQGEAGRCRVHYYRGGGQGQ